MLTLLRQIAGADLCLQAMWVDADRLQVVESDPPGLERKIIRFDRTLFDGAGHAWLEARDLHRLRSSALLMALPAAPEMMVVIDLADPRAGKIPGVSNRRFSDSGAIVLAWCHAAAVPAAVRADAPKLRRLVTEGRTGVAASESDTERLAAIMSVLPHGVVFIDTRRVEGLVNDAAARWLRVRPGVHQSGEIATAMQALQGRVKDSAEGRADAAILASGVDIALHDRIWELSDPAGVVLRVSSVPLRDAGESGRLWTFEDITLERHMLHEVSRHRELEKKLRQSQKLEAVGRLAAGLAHDFNNLLTVIAGSAEILSRAALTEGERTDLQDIESATTRARRITRQLLTFTSQQLEQPQVVEIDAIVREGSALLGKVTAPRSALTLDLHAGTACIFADPRSIELALLNLLANSRDASAPDSAITVRTERRVLEGEPAHGAALPLFGPHVAITVVDRGSGMDAATMASIFEPFFTTKAEGHGTGLGLATVLAIAQRAAGGVTVESTVGEGTAVTILLPEVHSDVAREQAAVQSGHESSSRPHHAHLLLVDDEAAPRRAVQRLLEHEGFTVEVAASGREAMARLESTLRPFDAVITDYMMPGMNGRELYSAIRAKYAQLPVVLISGFAPDTDADATRYDADLTFLAKPFRVAELVALIEPLLDQRHQDRPAT